ncbi:MAG: response regulator [bacterium]
MLDDLNYKSYPILYIDDEREAIDCLRLIIRDEFDLSTTTNPQQALKMIKEKDYAVVISDQKMSSMKGSKLLAAVKKICPDVITILMTAFTDLDVAISAVNEGEIYRYIPKTATNDETRLFIKQAIHQYHLLIKMKRLEAMVSEYDYDNIELIELQPEINEKKECRTNFIEDYNEDTFFLVQGYYNKLEGIASRAFGKLGADKNPEPGLRDKIEDLQIHFMAYTNIGDRKKVRKLLAGYLSEEEMAGVIYNQEIDYEGLSELLKEKIVDKDERNTIVSEVISAKAMLYQMVVYSPSKIGIIQQQLEGVYYTIYPRREGEKVIVQCNKFIDGEMIECRARDDGMVEGFDEDGKRLGMPGEFFEMVVGEVGE